MDAPITLRTAKLEDAERLHEVHISAVRALCSSHYSAEIIEGWLLNRKPEGFFEPIRRAAIFVAESEGDVVGFGEVAPGAVVAVYVEPSMARRGIGRRILEHALVLARGSSPEPVIVESTMNASEFYGRHGFREVSRSTVKRNHVNVPVIVMRHDAAA
ncbi:MAG TPA: GNAT family N-acetyltransferase [Casimicrobiaceae bacterium]|jgi:N-acetylglutamate synthase-like GNAT family acetyltransferase